MVLNILEAVSIFSRRPVPNVTSPIDEPSQVSYWSSKHADLVSRTVNELQGPQGGPEAVSAI
jgi:hypothetical protein